MKKGFPQHLSDALIARHTRGIPILPDILPFANSDLMIQKDKQKDRRKSFAVYVMNTYIILIIEGISRGVFKSSSKPSLKGKRRKRRD